MKANGRLTRRMAMASILTLMGQSMRATGSRISSMVRERRHGQMAHVMKAFMHMGRKKDKESSHGQTAQFMKEFSPRTISKDKVNTHGLMEESIKDHGKTTKCTE